MNNDTQDPTSRLDERDAVSLAEASRSTIIRCLNDTFRLTFAWSAPLSLDSLRLRF